MNRILVVGDEVDTLDIVKLSLESRGYTVDTAFSGEDALGMIMKEKPDLILLDVLLPGMNGIQVLEKVKKSKDTQSIKVVLFTALGPNVDVNVDPSYRADGFLSKPFSNSQMHEMIKRLLMGR